MTTKYNNFKITASETTERTEPKTWGGRRSVWFNRITVTNTETGKTTRFDYFRGIGNPREMNEEDLVSAFYHFVSDAVAGSDDFGGFVSDFGYTDPIEAYKIWKACKRAREKFDRVTGGADVWEMCNELSEAFG